MAELAHIKQAGDQLIAVFDDGTQKLAYPTQASLWIVKGVPPTPPPPPTPTIYNPWASWPVSSGGDWPGHGSYSLGGLDYPLPYGTELPAPANGTLQTSGGAGEWAAGWVGSAGRRSILHLDSAYPRLHGFSESSGRAIDHEGDLVAIVFQHQSAFGTDGQHYNLGEICGVSGASANGSNYGGEVHLHVHGLNALGQRMDFTKFVP